MTYFSAGCKLGNGGVRKDPGPTRADTASPQNIGAIQVQTASAHFIIAHYCITGASLFVLILADTWLHAHFTFASGVHIMGGCHCRTKNLISGDFCICDFLILIYI